MKNIPTPDLEKTLRAAFRADQDEDLEELSACLDTYYYARLNGAEEPRNGDARADTLFDSLHGQH